MRRHPIADGLGLGFQGGQDGRFHIGGDFRGIPGRLARGEPLGSALVPAETVTPVSPTI